MSGHLTIVLRDHRGQVVAQHQVNNLITTAGKTLVAELFTGALQGGLEFFIAVGDGTGKEAATDTDLRHRLDKAAAATPEIRSVNKEGQQQVVAKVEATLLALGADQQPQSLSEAGILITLPNGREVLYNRVTFPVVTRTSILDMTLTWEVLF